MPLDLWIMIVGGVKLPPVADETRNAKESLVAIRVCNIRYDLHALQLLVDDFGGCVAKLHALFSLLPGPFLGCQNVVVPISHLGKPQRRTIRELRFEEHMAFSAVTHVRDKDIQS